MVAPPEAAAPEAAESSASGEESRPALAPAQETCNEAIPPLRYTLSVWGYILLTSSPAGSLNPRVITLIYESHRELQQKGRRNVFAVLGGYYHPRDWVYG